MEYPEAIQHREGEQRMIDTSGNKPVIQVKMFGGFTITMDDKSMGDSDNRSRKAWNLLSYLIINRRKDVSINELFQAIWQDGMQDNPYGALKTLVFRVRKMMEAAGFPSQDLILNQKGAYMWNPSWELSIDTDRFEFLCRRILTSQEDMRDMEKEWKEALNLYRGCLLYTSARSSLDATVAFDTVSSFPFHSSWSINAFSLVVMMDSVLFL